MAWKVSRVSSSERVADDLAERTIDANETPVERDQSHPDRGSFDREPESLLRFLQRPFAALAFSEVTYERLPATVRQDVRAHLDRKRRAVLSEHCPFGYLDPAWREQVLAGRGQPGNVLRWDDIDDGLADELVSIVAEEPACGPVHVRESSVQIRLKECVGGKLDDIPSPRHRSRDLVTPLLHEKRQDDNDGPVYGEEQRQKSRLIERIARAYRHVSGERQAEQHGARPRPDACKQAGHQNRRKEQHG